MQDPIYFIVRYIPFWSIPSLLIFAQFAYIYWLKEVKWVAIVFATASVFCFLALIYYVLAGSPHDAAGLIRDNIFR